MHSHTLPNFALSKRTGLHTLPLHGWLDGLLHLYKRPGQDAEMRVSQSGFRPREETKTREAIR